MTARVQLPTVRGRQTQAAIDIAARNVVARKGILAATIADIAAEAGGAMQAVYNAGRSKADLLQRVGEVVVAGTAWAQHTGVERVEVRVDQGPWQPAELTTEYSIDTWRQWKFVWQATKGNHTLECRAIDRQGKPQIERYQAPAPDGASGLDDRTYTIV